jgi:hypothetical protein
MLRHESAGLGQASWALAAERLRPYTEQEAIAFLRLHQALRRALPRHRAELDEIAALARPLMPPGVQSARIDRPHPPVPILPVSCLPTVRRGTDTASGRPPPSRDAPGSACKGRRIGKALAEMPLVAAEPGGGT